MTETPDRPEADDPRVLALAKARQQMAHDNPFNVVCPPWDGLTEQEQHLSLLDARNYLRAALKAGLVPAAVSAGLAPATDRAAVRRDRYAAPLFALMRQNGWDGERTEPVVREMDLVLDAVLAVADAEQAVLPASLDRAAVLREAAAALAAKYGPSNRAAAELLRMAAEARGATGRPDGRGICPVCGRDYKLTGAGLLPRHTGHVPDHRADDGMSCRGVGEKPIAELRRMADEPPQPEDERRVYAWAQTIDTADGGETVHIPGTHHSGNGPETTAIVVDRADVPVLRAMLADVETPPADDATPLLFWDESAGAVHHDGRVAVWINKAVNLAEFAPAGQLILQVQAAGQLRDALGAALAEAAPAVVAQPDEEADDAPPAPLRRSEDDCPGFPEQCPDIRPVDPNPPVHYGGIRCGCADEEPS